ncbi:rhodanese-related sulfurtransferase [Rhodococcus sp. OK611]|uniref:rhodanese-like domain-containing protein n=1 Tax=unclassified Rhodococcus (in: high G+C Gram-positive bacteria) TaxID=192944 RepID=UPI000BCB1D1E|nr:MULTISPECIES: rhodanese-like domain-containing protein [unclassified Rhodococcus (in: high G+C Gram-positive bacteria)]PTR40037.1 rhodanese-related sulfurtransferase [Rhodococcus sp. OK611]SNX92504.1 Rhodanese-related sulfurtransferase [Rhodococcus sp. OK270]
MTIDEMLEKARGSFRRMYVFEVAEAVARGAIIVDIRPQAQRAAEGALPGALAIERNVLEWRLDPASSARIALAADHDVEWIVVCSEGYTSSLAAAALQELGLHRATDLVGGYQALRSAGLLGVATRARHYVREAAAVAAH